MTKLNEINPPIIIYDEATHLTEDDWNYIHWLAEKPKTFLQRVKHMIKGVYYSRIVKKIVAFTSLRNPVIDIDQTVLLAVVDRIKHVSPIDKTIYVHESGKKYKLTLTEIEN